MCIGRGMDKDDVVYIYIYTQWNTENEVKVNVIQSCPALCDPMDYTQPMEFSMPEYWSG